MSVAYLLHDSSQETFILVRLICDLIRPRYEYPQAEVRVSVILGSVGFGIKTSATGVKEENIQRYKLFIVTTTPNASYRYKLMIILLFSLYTY